MKDSLPPVGNQPVWSRRDWCNHQKRFSVNKSLTYESKYIPVGRSRKVL